MESAGVLFLILPIVIFLGFRDITTGETTFFSICLLGGVIFFGSILLLMSLGKE